MRGFLFNHLNDLNRAGFELYAETRINAAFSF